MKADNFIAFFTVCGFFIGVMFVIIRVSDPLEMLVYTALITFFFYLIIHIIVASYIYGAQRVYKSYFSKEKHEDINSYLINELVNREKRMENIFSKISIEKEKLNKTLDIKNAQRSKSKAA